MRSVLCVAIIGMLLLASCNSAPEATATPTETAEATVGVNPLDELSDFAGDVVIPVPGTLSVSDTSQTPNAPTPGPLAFNQVTLEQTGGPANVRLVIRLLSDGTLTYDGKVSTVGADQIQHIAVLLGQVDFFNINGRFATSSGAADIYHYALTVDSPIGSRTIFSQDGLTPPQLFEIYDAIRALGGN